MRMKSVLALTALSAATFLASVAYAADAKQTTSKALTQTPKAKAVAATPAPSKAEQAATPAHTEQVAAEPQAEHKGHKKHAHHKKHKKHHHHHHKHQHHRHHHEHRPVFFAYEEAPCWNFLLGGSLGYAAQKENFITRYTRPAPTVIPVGGGLTVDNAILPIYYDHSEKVTEQGVLFGLIAGWQWRYNRWLFGAEANVDFQSFEKDRQFTFTEQQTNDASTGLPVNVALTGTMLYDRGDIYAITARAGYFVTPFFMPYLRLGAQLSRDEVQYQVFTNGVLAAGGVALVAPVTNFFGDYSSRKKDVYGVVAGIGAEFPTYIGSSTIRFEYNFVKTDSVIITDNTFPIIGNHKFRYPESHIGKMAWIWNFM